MGECGEIRQNQDIQPDIVCARALKRFGLEKQMIKCIEELAELQKELCKLSIGQGSIENTIEEIADVEIMIEQMKIGMNISFYEFNKAKSKKLYRLVGILAVPEKKEPRWSKCRQCLHAVLTSEELIELGNDPCDTCNDLCNWKPKGVSV